MPFATNVFQVDPRTCWGPTWSHVHVGRGDKKKISWSRTLSSCNKYTLQGFFPASHGSWSSTKHGELCRGSVGSPGGGAGGGAAASRASAAAAPPPPRSGGPRGCAPRGPPPRPWSIEIRTRPNDRQSSHPLQRTRPPLPRSWCDRTWYVAAIRTAPLLEPVLLAQQAHASPAHSRAWVTQGRAI